MRRLWTPASWSCRCSAFPAWSPANRPRTQRLQLQTQQALIRAGKASSTAADRQLSKQARPAMQPIPFHIWSPSLARTMTATAAALKPWTAVAGSSNTGPVQPCKRAYTQTRHSACPPSRLMPRLVQIHGMHLAALITPQQVLVTGGTMEGTATGSRTRSIKETTAAARQAA